jgi:hypothetical protein
MQERERLSFVPEDIVIQVDRLTFLVPTRAFYIDGTLLKGGYVSVATEFALRVLRDAGEVPPGELGAFLGFSDLETRTLTQDLLLDGYLDVIADRLRLSIKGQQAFDPVTGELRLLDVEPFSDTVALDLVSFAPVDISGNARLSWLTEIEIPDKERAAAAREEAAKGFQSNFGEWRDRRFRSDSGSLVRLHTLAEVVPMARSSTPVVVPVAYSPSRGDGVEPDFSALRDRGRRDARKELVECLNEAVRRMVAPGDHAEGAAFTAQWDGGVLRGSGMTAVVNPLAWMQLASRTPPVPLPEMLSPSVRLSGSVTSSGFLSVLSTFLAGATTPETADIPVIWVPAEHGAWGASADLLDVTRQIRTGLAPEAGIVLMPRSSTDDRSRRTLVRAYGAGRDGRQTPLFETCIAIPLHAVPFSLELLVQPGAWAVVLLHVPANNGGFPIPIGYATCNVDVVRAVSSALAEIVGTLPEAAILWSARHEKAAPTLADLKRQLVAAI